MSLSSFFAKVTSAVSKASEAVSYLSQQATTADNWAKDTVSTASSFIANTVAAGTQCGVMAAC